jgi:hypothetical protein
MYCENPAVERAAIAMVSLVTGIDALSRMSGLSAAPGKA